MKRWTLVFLAIVPAMAGVMPAAAVTGILELHADLSMKSVRGVDCPPTLPKNTECHARSGEGVVPGLGHVTQNYSYNTTVAAPECGGLVKVLGHTAVFSVANKGDIYFDVHEAAQCLSPDAGLRATQTFTIIGGTGMYANASGSGRVERRASFTDTGAIGIDTWIGTLSVPGLEFDLTPPTIVGAASKTVRISKKARSAHVAYNVTGHDNVDASVPVACRPRSGGRFRSGRTTVRCSATDSSGNTARASFVITVKHRQ